MEADALGKAETAVESLNDPSELRQWLNALRKPNTSSDEPEDIYVTIRDLLARESRGRPLNL